MAAPKKNPVAQKRRSLRKKTHPLPVSKIIMGLRQDLFANFGELVEVSETGFRILVRHRDIAAEQFRTTLSLDNLVNEIIWIHLDEFNLVIDGIVCRTRFLGKGLFELGVDYSDSEPEYWRECLFELMPRPNEIQEEP